MQLCAVAVEEGKQSFDPTRTTYLQTDWSEDGIGFLLLQKHCNCSLEKVPMCCPDGWKLINSFMQDLVSLSLRNSTTNQKRVKLLQSHGPSITQECLLSAVLTSMLQ